MKKYYVLTIYVDYRKEVDIETVGVATDEKQARELAEQLWEKSYTDQEYSTKKFWLKEFLPDYLNEAYDEALDTQLKNEMKAKRAENDEPYVRMTGNVILDWSFPEYKDFFGPRIAVTEVSM